MLKTTHVYFYSFAYFELFTVVCLLVCCRMITIRAVDELLWLKREDMKCSHRKKQQNKKTGIQQLTIANQEDIFFFLYDKGKCQTNDFQLLWDDFVKGKREDRNPTPASLCIKITFIFCFWKKIKKRKM